jgi:hypothetical protein
MTDVVATIFEGTTITVHAKLQCKSMSPDWDEIHTQWETIYNRASRFWFVVDIREMGLAFTLANLPSIFNLLQKYRARSDQQVVETVLICNQRLQLPMITAVTNFYTPTRPMSFVADDTEAFAKTQCSGLPEIL